MTVPTKTVNFDDDVLTILQTLGVRAENGHYVGVLTCGQLERKLYERTNKALEALGGKWNRKAGGHVFPTDPREQLGGLIDSGSLIVERDGFFETPLTVVERMLELVPLPAYSVIVLEPSAGMGAILRVLLAHPNAHWSTFDVIEKNEQRRMYLTDNFPVKVVGDDFLKYELPLYRDGEIMYQYQRIYMNPPFENGQDIDHVCHAYELLQPNRVGDRSALVSVMSEGAFFRGDLKATQFRDWLDKVGGETYKLPADSFKESGTGVSTRLVVVRK